LDNRPTPPDLDGELQGEWFVGPSRSGKTSTAQRENPGAYRKNSSHKWWGRYNDEEVVIIDEWSPRTAELTDLLKIWTDRYAFEAEVKGGEIMIRPKKIIVTSQFTIDQCFYAKEDREAMHGRFKVRQFN